MEIKKNCVLTVLSDRTIICCIRFFFFAEHLKFFHEKLMQFRNVFLSLNIIHKSNAVVAPREHPDRSRS